MSNIFLRKIVKTVTFSRKIDKNFKTGVIVAHFDFFVKLFLKKIPDDSVVLISDDSVVLISVCSSGSPEPEPVVCDRLKIWHTCQLFANRSNLKQVKIGRSCPTENGLYRSAGACPLRWFDPNEKRP